MSRLYYLDEFDIHELVESLTVELFPGTPAFQVAGGAGRDRLLSALGQPQWPHHRTAQQKAAVLHHAINKGHPYIDDNKRLALTAMLTFLHMNGFEMHVTDSELEHFALGVADDWLARDESAKFVRERAERLSWTEPRKNRWIASLGSSAFISMVAAFTSRDSTISPSLTAQLLREIRASSDS